MSLPRGCRHLINLECIYYFVIRTISKSFFDVVQSNVLNKSGAKEM